MISRHFYEKNGYTYLWDDDNVYDDTPEHTAAALYCKFMQLDDDGELDDDELDDDELDDDELDDDDELEVQPIA
ncbi:hypothetical protein HDV00_001527 [Rhizophlyctis rosea]|nr:hypothetical protein HDV00_001527 [Rhizophlyctis rosea]